MNTSDREEPDMDTAHRPLGGFEERLLAELKDVVAANAPAPVPGRRAVPARRRLARRPAALPGSWVRRAVVAGALSAALAAGLLISGTVTIGGRPAVPGNTAEAATFLNHAAAAARVSHDAVPQPNQLVWKKWLEAPAHAGLPQRNQLTGGCVVAWAHAPGMPGQEFQEPQPFSAARPACAAAVPPKPPKPSLPGVQAHNCPDIRALPTDPATLLASLRQLAARPRGFCGFDSGDGVNDKVFGLVAGLLQAGIPASLRAALYEAAATIPGVTLIPHAVDAAGRHGVAIARPALIDFKPGRYEFILNPTTYRFLGWAAVTASGTVVTSYALLQSGFVNPPRS